jgi:hypothetical protein
MKCITHELSSPEIFDGDTGYPGIYHCCGFPFSSSFYDHETG